MSPSTIEYGAKKFVVFRSHSFVPDATVSKKAEIDEILAKVTITPDQLHRSKILPLSRNAIYQAIERGEIDAIKLGRKKVIVMSALRKKLGIE